MENKIVVRIQSAEHGTKRFQVKPTEKVSDFLDSVQAEFGLGDLGWKVFQQRNKLGELRPSRSKTLNSYKIRHGDMLFLHMTNDTGHGERSKSNLETASVSVAVINNVVEDEVDQYLNKLDGRIPRNKNEQMCRHGSSGKCFHCVPLEPYDETYLNSMDPPIKFLSFHSYIRKLTSGVDKGKFVNLENLSCKIKEGCKEHPPWPGGICTKCQPNAVTLNRQKYRHIDYIQFENPVIMDRFLNYWRSTGCQRIGYLYGRYEHYKDVPLGIKAVVAAIYEPQQRSEKNSIELIPNDEEDQTVKNIATRLGLRKVGWIFTDLIAKDLSKGTVKNYRGNIDSHFLSAEECIMAADLQNKHPNPCKLSSDGHFGSKFVTVVVTGNSSNQIHFEGYQVSDQCMALVNDECLVPTVDAPELAYVKESSNEQYVPDVFYKEIDEYKNEVTRIARPLPVEYLLLDMPTAFPVDPLFTFTANPNQKTFPIEHRETLGEIQDFNAFASYMSQYRGDKFVEGVSDFHLLIYMSTCDMLPLKNQMISLLEAVLSKDRELLHHWMKTEEWATVEQLMDVHGSHSPLPSGDRSSSGGPYVGPHPMPLPPIGSRSNSVLERTGGNAGSSTWTCKHCTFINSATEVSCDMCSLPKE